MNIILKLKRVFFSDKYTIGKLFINNAYFCDVLEDKDRDLNKDGDLSDEGEQKVFGQTCIPRGEYKVIITESNRFKKRLPLLLNVPGFEGIRIHGGNTADDTHGCLLVGENKEKGKILNSQNTLGALMKILEESDSIKIIIS